MSQSPHKKIYIEGNIGSGKSTFLELLSKYLHKFKDHNIDASIVQEPVDLWLNTKDSDGENILEKFYKDQDKWSYAFQMNSFISRLKVIDEKIKKICHDSFDTILFIERSIYTDKNCFARLLYENGKMTQLEYDIYVNWNDWLAEEFKARADAYIYLYCDPVTNDLRIKERNRNGESDIPLDYLKKLHEKHEIWMNNEKEKNVKVFTIDALENFKNKQKMDEIFEKLVEFIKGL